MLSLLPSDARRDVPESVLVASAYAEQLEQVAATAAQCAAPWRDDDVLRRFLAEDEVEPLALSVAAWCGVLRLTSKAVAVSACQPTCSCWLSSATSSAETRCNESASSTTTTWANTDCIHHGGVFSGAHRGRSSAAGRSLTAEIEHGAGGCSQGEECRESSGESSGGVPPRCRLPGP